MKKHLLGVLAMALSLSSFAQYWDVPQQNTNLPQSRGIQTISVVDQNIVWADTYDGTGQQAKVTDFIVTSDGGVNWTANSLSNVPAGWEFSHFAGFSDAMAWATCFSSTAAGAHVYRTLDGGLSWEEKNPYSATAFANVVHFFNDLEGMTMGDPVGGYYEIYTTSDGGDTWTRVPQANIPAPLNSSEYGLTRSIGTFGDNVWFGTNKSRVYRSTDKGLTWAVSDLSAIVPPTTAVSGAVTDFAMESATTGMCFISGTDTINRLVKTTDGGATWTQVLSGTQKAGFIKWRNGLAHVTGSNPSRYFITGARTTYGDFGSVYSDDMGATWVTVDSAVQHLGTAWATPKIGWSGGFTGAGGAEGMFAWKDTTFGVATYVPWSNGEVVGYPNPTQDVYTVSMNQFVKSTFIAVRLSDLTGKEVYKYEVPAFNGKFKHTIEMENLNTGIYFLNLQVGDQMITKKVTKN